MHRCFHSLDILLYIIETLCPLECLDAEACLDWKEERDYTGRATVTALAQVCKYFLEPCLNAVWRHLYSLTPLLNCLEDTPSPPLRPGDLNPALLRNPGRLESAADLNWSRFDYYAYRIRSLLTDPRDGIPDTVFLALGTHRRAPLIPQLQHLFWYRDDRTILPYLSLFCGPALQQLGVFPGLPPIESGHDKSSICALAFSLSLRCPSLRSIAIWVVRLNRDDGSYLDLQNEVSWMILALHPLHSFRSAIALLPTAFVRLSTMPSLRSINLVGVESLSNLVTSPVWFPNLEAFTFSEIALSEVTHFLKGFGTHHSFKIVNVATATCQLGDDIEEFVRALCTHCNPETLMQLRLHLSRFSPFVGHLELECDKPLGYHPFVALRQFSQLRICSIKACQVRWEDQFLEDVAPAWHLLQELQLNSLQFSGSMHSLIPLAMHCLDLNKISLELSNWDNPSPVIMAFKRPDSFQKHLAPRLYISLDNVPRGFERQVAAMLQTLFPNVYAVRGPLRIIRHDWPEYENLTEEDYSSRSNHFVSFRLFHVTFPYAG